MNPHFLFPSSPLNPRIMDEAFFDQAIALKMAGFGTSAISVEEDRIVGTVPEGSTVVYRGWMMNESEYISYQGWCLGRGLTPFTSREQYLATHHLPNWYPLLEKWTPQTVVVPPEFWEVGDLVAFCKNLGWEKFQVKDYVKSLKTAGGSVAVTPEQVPEIVENMRKFRGTIEGGIVVRRWEDFVSGSERRYFVINGRYFSQDGAFDIRHMRILARVHDVVPSPFYSVDIAQPSNTDYEARLVEIGDGQVSDLVGWSAQRFAEIWK
jgi:ATP-grasp domain, R2K clade family 3